MVRAGQGQANGETGFQRRFQEVLLVIRARLGWDSLPVARKGESGLRNKL